LKDLDIFPEYEALQWVDRSLDSNHDSMADSDEEFSIETLQETDVARASDGPYPFLLREMLGLELSPNIAVRFGY
jgi:hypothetical protein